MHGEGVQLEKGLLHGRGGAAPGELGHGNIRVRVLTAGRGKDENVGNLELRIVHARQVPVPLWNYVLLEVGKPLDRFRSVVGVYPEGAQGAALFGFVELQQPQIAVRATEQEAGRLSPPRYVRQFDLLRPWRLPLSHPHAHRRHTPAAAVRLVARTPEQVVPALQIRVDAAPRLHQRRFPRLLLQLEPEPGGIPAKHPDHEEILLRADRVFRGCG
mmetsp:Transcript_20463/g.51692  ORF Transcript_20463/g.51692 Transcript_20463/m.51692 type:complete len:215 (+) Transcript_20463:3029-3673(+)